MAELDTTYRTPRHRPGMDPNTRKLALHLKVRGLMNVQ